MKKIISLALALVMILSLAVFTFADAPALGTGDGSITITNAQSGKTYTIYKLFDAEVGEKKAGDTTAPISYYIDKGDFADLYAAVAAAKMSIEYEEEDPDTHETVTKNKDVALFKLKATADEDIFQVEKGAEATDEGVLNWVKSNYANYELPFQTKSATTDELEFADIPYGYYVIEAEGSEASQVSVNSTKPDVEVAIKVPTTPSNPQKVQDKDQVTIGGTITYNASVKAVNTYVGTGNPPKVEKVKRYTVMDTPDEDQNGMSIPTIKVYAAADIADYTDTNGDIICGDNGLYSIPSTVAFATVGRSATYASWQTADGTGKEPVDGWYFLKADATTPANMILVPDEEAPTLKYDMRYVAIPWQKADGSFKYDANSYIVLTYTQTVGAGLDSIDSIDQSELFDGVYTNKIKFGFQHDNTSETIGDEKIVKAYDTAISLRKLYDGSDDTKTLDGAEFKFKNNTTGDENYGKWYSDNSAEIAAAKAQNAERAAILAQNEDNAEWNEAHATEIAGNPELEREIVADADIPAEVTVPTLEIEWVATEAEASILVADNSYTTVEIHSLNSGDYILKEVKAPEGYQIPDYQWNVNIVFDDEATGTTSFAHYTVKIKQTNQSTYGAALGNNGHDFFTVQIVNTKGTELPHTGGAGTVALVAIGTLLFLATGVVLVTKKRLYNEG